MGRFGLQLVRDKLGEPRADGGHGKDRNVYVDGWRKFGKTVLESIGCEMAAEKGVFGHESI